MDRPRFRRSLLLGSVASLVAAPAWLSPVRAQGLRLRPTPSQTEGPFYPLELPADSDADLLRNGAARYAQGRPCLLQGTVLDLEGRALQGAVVEIWQCDAAGHYHHPGDGARADPAFQGFGRVAVDREGRYRFRTIRPVPYTGRTPHIHVKVRLDRRELLTTQLYVQDEPGNARDGLWRRLDDSARAALTRPFEAGPDGERVDFPLTVQA